MGRFNGVVTRYLENDIGWHRWLDGKEQEGARRFLADAISR
ncbi:MAG: hypothetical protein AW08_01636 [Candidatus Accumulibacter adjunctus]|uniref:Uncharacterized protein n=1 Tax=Candidatus Accumulibacter adjunctus TaxID=1454001 RepID=A0A011MZN0_9PROT|nr:MAG: hypothetical protein AW08_01636 [Candidatus Accumulibacter adjunctus]